MRLLGETKLEFMQKRRLALGVSLVLVVLSLVSLGLRGLNFGVDFTGGTVIEVGYEEAVALDDVRERLAAAGLDDVSAQHFGSVKDVLIRAALDGGRTQSELSNRVLEELQRDGGVTLRRVEFVGPRVGEELREDGGLAMLYALLGILLYVAFRFEYRFAFGAVIALIHDVLLTIGFFSVTGVEFDLSVLAAVLAVIGYSLNDTIVVYDRIRESFMKIRKRTGVRVDAVVNFAINKTLARTLVTSMTTMLVLIALFALGSEVIRGFTVAMMIGIVVGTYSSIYIAGASLLFLGLRAENMMQVKKEGEEFGRP